MRRPLVAGNWKMNGSLFALPGLLAGVKQGAADTGGVEVAVFPPYVYLPQVQQELSGSQVAWGAQNLSDKESGAFTGEVAAPMLLEFGCQYVLVGHSERRTLFGESDDAVAAKVSAARRAGLKPVLCIGETLEERENDATEAVVARQLQAVMDFEGIQ
ncbi:MAG: triose-phosphate isomerase, partial [Candidatus Competibacteraceae bacterium]|nr:triose-phosphate isomerase [Candidatus Competibacteraceae bacterium]